MDAKSDQLGDIDDIVRYVRVSMKAVLPNADSVEFDDRVSDALMAIWKSKDEVKDPAALKSWLATVIRRAGTRTTRPSRHIPIALIDDVLRTEDREPWRTEDEVRVAFRAANEIQGLSGRVLRFCVVNRLNLFSSRVRDCVASIYNTTGEAIRKAAVERELPRLQRLVSADAIAIKPMLKGVKDFDAAHAKRLLTIITVLDSVDLPLDQPPSVDQVPRFPTRRQIDGLATLGVSKGEVDCAWHIARARMWARFVETWSTPTSDHNFTAIPDLFSSYALELAWVLGSELLFGIAVTLDTRSSQAFKQRVDEARLRSGTRTMP